MSMIPSPRPSGQRAADGVTVLVIVLIGLVVLRWQGAPLAIAASAVVAVTRTAAVYASRPAPIVRRPRA